MIRTKDNVIAYTAMRVYGINPWGDIEVLYVGFNTEESETNNPHEATGASKCIFKTKQCYADEDLARAEACTYTEDEEGLASHNPRNHPTTPTPAPNAGANLTTDSTGVCLLIRIFVLSVRLCLRRWSNGRRVNE